MDYEIWYTVRCALNVALTLHFGSPTAEKLVDWLESDGVEIGIDLPEWEDDDSRPRRYGRSRRPSERLSAEKWEAYLSSISSFVAQAPQEKECELQINLDQVSGEMGLKPVESEVFSAFVRYRLFDPFEHLCDAVTDANTVSAIELLGRMLKLDVHEIRSQVGRECRLFRLGLIEVSGAISSRLSATAEVPEKVVSALLPPNSSAEDFRRTLLGSPQVTALGWSDFEHIPDDRGLVFAILRNAIESKERGINILLYGPPGTGKTEFAKVLATRLDVPCYSVGECDDYGSDPSVKERLANLRLANALISGKSNGLLLFDEMEDLGTDYGSLFGKRDSSPSKVFLNRLMETNPVPTIWTTNDIYGFDPALRRRMTYAIEMRVPPRRMRERVWHKLLEKESLSLDAKGIAELAKEFPESPALAANAVRAARLAGGDARQIRQAVQSVAMLIHGKRPKPQSGQKAPYELGLLNADLDLQKLTTRICGLESARRVSFCLSGPPGTGKSAYVRHLADRMGLEVLHKRASDLLSMWLGESEKNIADAFGEAREEEAFLVFDEADSLLQSREGAQRRWEVTQVNEMLTWMECHDYPFACTTNFKAGLDPASLRRFTFKVNFGFLSARQREAAFRLYFEMEPPAGLARLWNLTPGDFAVARRKAEVLGCLENPEELLELLQDESLAKSGNRPVGFRTA